MLGTVTRARRIKATTARARRSPPSRSPCPSPCPSPRPRGAAAAICLSRLDSAHATLAVPCPFMAHPPSCASLFSSAPMASRQDFPPISHTAVAPPSASEVHSLARPCQTLDTSISFKSLACARTYIHISYISCIPWRGRARRWIHLSRSSPWPVLAPAPRFGFEFSPE